MKDFDLNFNEFQVTQSKFEAAQKQFRASSNNFRRPWIFEEALPWPMDSNLQIFGLTMMSLKVPQKFSRHL